MKFQRTQVAYASVLCLACWVILPTSAMAQVQNAPVKSGERLGDWLIRNAGPNADTTALHWRVLSQIPAQEHLRSSVLDSMRALPADNLSVSQKQNLLTWLGSLPLTGRVNLSTTDPRWLENGTVNNPVLQDGHQVVLYPRPTDVVVVTESGQPCLARFRSGALIKDYLHACLSVDTVQGIDTAWLAQPDGRTSRAGIALWNQEDQLPPAPGAWIWAPSRTVAIPESVSDNLIRFFATQSPVPANPVLAKFDPDAFVPLQSETPKSIQLKASDWGEIGLIQTPTARMEKTGAVRFQLSRVAPYTRGTVMFQPLDWMEAGFRYTDVSNRLYGAAIAGDQTYKDKSIDIKLRLLEETHVLPQIALGLRDIGGTGLFSGEYLVANKRWGNWDASLGLGWGYLGARGNLKNPLSILSSGFNDRALATGSSAAAGNLNTSSLFHGSTALFGGVQWQKPESPWTLKFELDGNAYQKEPQGNNQIVKSPFNFGAVYTYSPNVDLSFALERGNSWMFGLTVHGALDQIYSPKILDRAMPPITSSIQNVQPPAGLGKTAENINIYTGWNVRSIVNDAGVSRLLIESDGSLYLQEKLDRTVAVLNRDMPFAIHRFAIQLQERGLPLTEVEVDRAEWVRKRTLAEAPAVRLPEQQVLPLYSSGQSDLNRQSTGSRSWFSDSTGFSYSLDPSYSQILGGPNNFLLYQAGVQANVEKRFSDRTWLSATANARLIDNYGNFVFDGPSNLPRVRTDSRRYTTTSRFTLPLMQLTHVRDIGNSQYLSAYGGLLESMYGGVGAEWLYRPWQGRTAFGVDVNYVRQRDFAQNLAFRTYTIGTGHATLYWDTGWNDLQVKLSAGRYLAGDIGATLDVKRVFQNGVAVGAWATKTNVSAEQFGEGSFDKGIYVNIPFDAMLPKSSPGTANIVWNPLTRDGGARLSRAFTLFDLTKTRDPRAFKWRESKPAGYEAAEDTNYILTEPAPNLFQRIGRSGTSLGQQVSDIPASTWLWAGGAVLASSLLDKKVDNWAQNHQTNSWNRVGSLGNNLPLAMALGAGFLYTGIAGEGVASTAETSLKAGLYTIGAATLTRFAVGRSRPYEGMGSANFDGFNSSAFQSGFPSNHVALAFAVATPFAQQQDMPWLYGAAALSAFGRIQSREHWLSDTVASGLMGYAIGTLVGNQSKSPKDVKFSVTPNSIKADWSFK